MAKISRKVRCNLSEADLVVLRTHYQQQMQAVQKDVVEDGKLLDDDALDEINHARLKRDYFAERQEALLAKGEK